MKKLFLVLTSLMMLSGLTLKGQVNLRASEGQLTLETTKAIGEKIYLFTEGDDNAVVTGADKTDEKKYVGFIKCTAYILTSQTVTINGNLTQLITSENNLTSIDINSDSLVKVWCAKNQLSSVNITSAQSLEFIDCTSNEIEAIDMSNCPNLKTLFCEKNETLASINVSQNSLLEKVHCGFSKELKELDFSDNPKMQTLFSEFSPQLAKVIFNSEGDLNYIVINNCNISQKENIDALFASLPKCATTGEFYLVDTKSSTEKNQATKQNVADALAKNWKVYDFDVESGDVVEYTGVNKLGLDNININNVTVYPNPATDYIQISGIKNSQNVYVIDMMGNVVVQKELNSSSHTMIDITQLNSGQYIVKVGNRSFTIIKE